MFEEFSLKKAIFAGLTYYVPTFLIGMAFIKFVPNVASYVWWLVSIVFMVVSMKYVYKPTTGFEMAIVFLITTLVIEIPMLVYGMGYGWALYSMWTVWVQYGLLIVTPLIAKKFM